MTTERYIVIAERTMRNRDFALSLTTYWSEPDTALVSIQHDVGQSYGASQHIGPLSSDSPMIDDALATFGLTRDDAIRAWSSQ